MKKLDTGWERVEKKYLLAITHVTGLQFKNLPVVYTNSRGHNFSNPVTAHLKQRVETTIHNLVHELIHYNLSQESFYPKTDKYIKKLHNDFKKYEFVVRVHILVHAIHHEVLKFVNASPRTIHAVVHYPDGFDKRYTLAWKIAKKVGYPKVVQRYTNSRYSP